MTEWLIINLNLSEHSGMNDINDAIQNDIMMRTNATKQNRHKYDEDAQEIKCLLTLRCNKYRSFLLNKRLHYSQAA